MKPDRVCGGDEEEDETIRLGFSNFLGLYIILAVMIFISFGCLFFKLVHLWLRDNYVSGVLTSLENRKQTFKVVHLWLRDNYVSGVLTSLENIRALRCN